MTEELEQYLRTLHLKKILEVVDEQIALANSEQITYEELLVRLMRMQCHDKQIRALTWRIKNAKLPEGWTLESFPFDKQPGANPRQIKTFAELDFIGRAENLVFIGPTGVGKTGLASAILLKALQNGYRGLFVKAQDLFDEMYSSLADRSSLKMIKRLAKIDVLLIDEMGYLNLRPEQSNVFFKLMEERYSRKPTILTTNLEYEEWYEFLGNRPMVDALLSRLRHRCHTVHIKGPSLRKPQG